MATSHHKTFTKWSRRILWTLLTVELLWLMVLNLALALPVTQTLINDLRPEKVHLSWGRGISLYPGQFSFRDVVVSGQTARLQYQATAQRVKGNLSLLALTGKRVEVTRGFVTQGEYRQRPRLKPGEAVSDAHSQFPAIDHYEISPVQERRIPRKKPWTVVIHQARLSGSHYTWIKRLQGRLDMKAIVDLRVRSQGGPLELHINTEELNIHEVLMDHDQQIISSGLLAGTISLGPYSYHEDRGRASLKHLALDLEGSLGSQSLDFVGLFLRGYPSLSLVGNGEAAGRLVLDRGVLKEGTKVTVDARQLRLEQSLFSVAGEGTIQLDVNSDPEFPFSTTLALPELFIEHRSDRSRFLQGTNLTLRIENDGVLIKETQVSDTEDHDFRASIEIPNATVESMATFNRFFPEESPVQFTEGRAALTTNIQLRPDTASGTLNLVGDDLRVHLDGQDFGLDLKFNGIVSDGLPLQGRFDLDGSHLDLTNVWVLGSENSYSDTKWSAVAYLSEAQLELGHPIALKLESDLTISDSRPMSALFQNHGGPAWVARRLAVDELSGGASLFMRDGRMRIPDARLGATELEVAMRGDIGPAPGKGMFYLRYKRLDAALLLEDGARDIILVRPREKFDAFELEPLPEP